MKPTHPVPKPLDCIAMKRRIQAQIASETKGMGPRQRLAYYRKLAKESPFSTDRRPGRKTRVQETD